MGNDSHNDNITLIMRDLSESKKMRPDLLITADKDKGDRASDLFEFTPPASMQGKTNPRDKNQLLLPSCSQDSKNKRNKVTNDLASDLHAEEFSVPIPQAKKNRNKKGVDLNFLQISRDIDSIKKLKGKRIDESLADMPDEMRNGRFDIMPANAISNHQMTRAKGYERHVARRRLSAKNYRQEYLENKKIREKALIEFTTNKPPKLLNYQLTSAEQYRHRASEIKNQIDWWNKQYGQDRFDDTTISTTIHNLTFELNGIPDVHKN